MKLQWSFDKKYLGFNDKPFMLVGIPLTSFMMPFFFGQNISEATACLTQGGFFVGIVFTTMFWLGDRAIVINLRRFYPEFSQIKKRLLINLISLSIYTLLGTYVVVFFPVIFSHEHIFIKESLWHSFWVCFFLTLFVTAIYEAGYYVYKWKESIAIAEKLKKESIQSQLEALKNQINPHFLFNSLNILASIIPEDPKAAVDFIYKLSRVYRNILDLKDKPIDSLSEEMEYLENYKYLLQARFGTNLNFEINVHDTCMECYTVPLCLQMLVENAIKHNVISQKKPLHIIIESVGLDQIVVSNNIQLKDQKSEGTGTGLKNINDRYRLTFGKNIDISSSDGVFKVSLPLISIQDYESTHR